MGMEHYLAEETLIFLRACLLGVSLGVCYDVLRIFRIAIKCNAVFLFIQDFLYFIFAALLTFGFLLAFNDGELRLYILTGELAGFVVYFFTVGQLVMKLSRLIIKLIRKLLRILFFPFVWLFRKFGKLFCFLGRKIKKIEKKLTGNLDLRLKNTVSVVYNKTTSKKKAKSAPQSEQTPI